MRLVRSLGGYEASKRHWLARLQAKGICQSHAQTPFGKFSERGLGMRLGVVTLQPTWAIQCNSKESLYSIANGVFLNPSKIQTDKEFYLSVIQNDLTHTPHKLYTVTPNVSFKNSFSTFSLPRRLSAAKSQVENCTIAHQQATSTTRT